MATIKKYDLTGTSVGEVEMDDIQEKECGQLIKDYIVAYRHNQRQWSASTKGRSEVSHSTKKPHPQKGTGRARQGSLAAPQFRGGGIVFGPKPKFDQHVRVNRKERRKALRFMFAEKMKEGRVHILDEKALGESFSSPKTKAVTSFLKALELQGKNGKSKRVLFISESASAETKKRGKKKVDRTNFFKSIRNIPRSEHVLAPNLNGYQMALASDLILTEGAVNELESLLKSRGE